MILNNFHKPIIKKLKTTKRLDQNFSGYGFFQVMFFFKVWIIVDMVKYEWVHRLWWVIGKVIFESFRAFTIEMLSQIDKLFHKDKWPETNTKEAHINESNDN